MLNWGLEIIGPGPGGAIPAEDKPSNPEYVVLLIDEFG